jgi:hypothetical protein
MRPRTRVPISRRSRGLDCPRPPGRWGVARSPAVGHAHFVKRSIDVVRIPGPYARSPVLNAFVGRVGRVIERAFCTVLTLVEAVHWRVPFGTPSNWEVDGVFVGTDT